MTRAHSNAFVLALIASVPFAWLACGGGEQKPAESPSSENSASASAEEAGASEAPAASSAAPAATAETAASSSATAEATAAAPPPPPTLGSTDCGACIDKTCAKQEAACGKNSDCQTMLDSLHSCTSGASSCLGSVTEPTAAKPKKLGAAVEACAKKAMASKTCKAKCQ